MDNQDVIFDLYLGGKNILITGAGGCGKSYIIKKIYDDAVEKEKNISVTALTGIAAILLDCNATTIHSWGGIGLCKGSYSSIISKVCKSMFKKINWMNTDILIIDEISMMSLEVFEILDKIGRTLLNKKKPFGGIQIILSGDFFQLPPINVTKFCFESELFLESFDKIVNLKKIYRQTDSIFRNILLNMRLGKISKKSIELLNGRIIKKDELNKLLQKENITRLVSKKNKASLINLQELNKLKTDSNIYSRELIEDKSGLKKIEKIKLESMTQEEKNNELTYIKNSTLTDDIITLKKDAFVMCIANIDIENKIVNGSQGIIINFDYNNDPIVKFNNGIIKTVGKYKWKSENIPGLYVKHVPLILAWCVTIHKAQGLTLEKIIVDAGYDIFECGQMYVALSRVRTLEGLYLENFDINRLKVNETVLNFYKNLLD